MSATFVARVSASTASSTDNITTAAFTTSGSNRAIAVCAALRTSVRRITGVSRGGSDTFADSGTDKQVAGQTCAADLWWSSNEPVTALTALSITIDAAVTVWGANVVVLSDVNQTTRFGNAVANSDTAVAGGLDDLTVDSGAVGDLVLDFFSVLGNTGTVSADGSQTDRGGFSASTGGNEIDSNVSTLPSTGSNVSMGWSGFATATYIAHIGFVAFGAGSPPTLTLPSGYIVTSNIAFTAISGLSVAAGSDPVTTLTLACTSGQGVMTLSGSGSCVVTGNGTNSISLDGGSETDFNNTLDTLAFKGVAPTQQKVTINALATDGTTTDSGSFVLFNDVTSLSVTATTYAAAVACFATLYARLPANSTQDTITLTATDEDTLEDEQVITLLVASNLSTATPKDFTKQNFAVAPARRQR